MYVMPNEFVIDCQTKLTSEQPKTVKSAVTEDNAANFPLLEKHPLLFKCKKISKAVCYKQVKVHIHGDLYLRQ